MRIVTLILFSLSLSAFADDLAQQTPPGQVVVQPTPPAQEEEPIWLGDAPPSKAQPPPPPARKGKAGAPTPERMVIYHWIDAEGVDTYSDMVPPEYRGKAVPIDAELGILRWSI